jgi:hypothetical protein
MKIILEGKTIEFQKPVLISPLIAGDPWLPEVTQLWLSNSNIDLPPGLIIPYGDFASNPTKAEMPFIANTSLLATLLDRDDTQRFRTRWDALQSMFADDPRTAIQEADGLVAEIVEKITKKSTIQSTVSEDQLIQWKDIASEDLHYTLQLYRSLFNRLVV